MDDENDQIEASFPSKFDILEPKWDVDYHTVKLKIAEYPEKNENFAFPITITEINGGKTRLVKKSVTIKI